MRHAYTITTKSNSLQPKIKEVENDKRSKRLPVLLYPAGVQISRLLAAVVTIDDKAVDRGGRRRWTWRNLCCLRTPHLCPYLHQRRLFTQVPTLTLWRNISATEADIWKNRTQARRNTSRQISWREIENHKNSDQSEVLLRSVCSMVKMSNFVTPVVCRVCQQRIAVDGKGIPRWFGLASLHILHVRWSCRGSRTFGTNFHFLSVFVVSEKKNHGPGWRQTQRECPGELRAKSTEVWTKKNRPVPIWRRALANWRRALANWRRALARKSSYFDKIAQLSVSEPQDPHESLEIEGFVAMGSLVERLHLLTAVSVVARAWRYRLHPKHAPGLLLCMW